MAHAGAAERPDPCHWHDVRESRLCAVYLRINGPTQRRPRHAPCRDKCPCLDVAGVSLDIARSLLSQDVYELWGLDSGAVWGALARSADHSDPAWRAAGCRAVRADA